KTPPGPGGKLLERFLDFEMEILTDLVEMAKASLEVSMGAGDMLKKPLTPVEEQDESGSPLAKRIRIRTSPGAGTTNADAGTTATMEDQVMGG
ncbi:unnamed protein product, partial [Amoebophrya sp. A120]